MLAEDNLIARLSMPSMLFAIGFAILGVSLGIIARKVAVVVRKTNEIDNKDPIMIGIQSVGVACLFVSILIIFHITTPIWLFVLIIPLLHLIFLL